MTVATCHSQRRIGRSFGLLLVPVLNDQFEPTRDASVHAHMGACRTDLSLWGIFGSCSFRRATSVCMNLLKGVSFFLPPAAFSVPR